MPREPVVPYRSGFPLHVLLWLAQALLALLFASTGFMKLQMDPSYLVASGMSWAGRMPEWAVRVIGALEMLGAAGLILPSLFRIQPRLTPIAAACLGLLMVVAGIEHLAHGETRALPTNLLILALALFVAWGRWKKVPIHPGPRHPSWGPMLPT